MADVTITAVDVRPLPGAQTDKYQLAEDMNIGTLVYLNSSGKIAKADADAAASAQAIGILVSINQIARTAGYADEFGDVTWLGPVAGFSGLTPGALYYSSTTAGAISDTRPAGSSGDYVWIVGRAKSATIMQFDCWTDDFAAQ